MTLPQGFGPTTDERLPLPDEAGWTDAQRALAQALLNSPRRAVLGPFVPLMQAPLLGERVGALGEALRYQGSLPAAVREWVVCRVARHTGNQFEWCLHAPLARAAGVPAPALEALRQGRRPAGLPDALQCADDLAQELLHQHGVADASFADAQSHFGAPGVVELATLVGYFWMVCGVMNLARTPASAGHTEPGLPALPL